MTAEKEDGTYLAFPPPKKRKSEFSYTLRIKSPS